MELATGTWYASLTFWTITGPVVAVLSTLAIVWVTIRVADPKRRLMYAMPVITPLLNSVEGVTADIEVRRRGQVLKSPCVVELKLSTRGRRDIPREAFDGGRPIRLDIGTPIAQCLKVRTDPADRSKPDPKIDGSVLLIGPTLIGKRQTTVFSLLVDGSKPHLSTPEQTLIDVDIQRRDPDAAVTARYVVPTVVSAASVVGVTAGASIAASSKGLSWAATMASAASLATTVVVVVMLLVKLLLRVRR